MPPKPTDCPRFDSCNAAVCPLEPVPSVHLKGEQVCYYLRNHVKAGAAERFKDDPVFAAVVEQAPIVLKRYPDIARRVAEAAKSSWKGANLLGVRP
jgi:hypothetical protein